MIPETDPRPLTPEERRLQHGLRWLAFLFVLAAFGYLLPSLLGPWKGSFLQLPFVTNSVVKISVLGMLAFLASGNVRRHRSLLFILLAGHVVSELAMGAVLLWGNLEPPLWPPQGLGFGMQATLIGAMALDGVILLLFGWLFIRADRAFHRLLYLNPLEFHALAALADVLISGEGERLSPHEVARNVDRYLAGFRARRKWIAKVALTGLELYPLLSFRPPLSTLGSLDRRAFLTTRFYQTVSMRLVPEFWRTLVQAMIRFGSQLSYLGYYSDPRTFGSVGYTPFSRRPDTPERLAASPEPERRPLEVLAIDRLEEDPLAADYVIVGTGAGASILAHQLVAAGKDVLMLERGPHVDRSEFSEDEVEMLSALYADGALQLSRDFRFQVLQGSCVGGTTVVNNAVCFDLPAAVLARWNEREGIDAQLPPADIHASAQAVHGLVGIRNQAGPHLNPSGRLIQEAISNLGLANPPNAAGVVEANIQDCLGCGYCNIGCAYGKKLSMLDRVLPEAQAAGPGRLRILPECEVVRLRGRGETITGLECRDPRGRPLRVEAGVVVLAAGAINSSLILLRSHAGGPNVGRRLSFNAGSPISGVFSERIRAYAGLQISHYLELEPSRGYILETWYNPPVSQALTMPGWFDDHYRNMERYDRTASLGVLVGTQPNGRVQTGGLTGRIIDYTPSHEDLKRILEGLTLGGEILYAAGAEEVMPHTFTYQSFDRTQREAFRRFPNQVHDASDITLGTGHPQGGNCLSGNRGFSVVTPEFRVHGYRNLFVTDASVFPTSVGVNPQVTVMTLAHYAARFVAAVTPRP